MESFFRKSAMLVAACLVLAYAGCDLGGGDIETGSRSVISLTGISATESTIQFTWEDPDLSKFNHLVVSWTDDTTTGASGDIAAGTLSYEIGSSANLSTSTVYTVKVKTLDSSDNLLGYTTFFVRTAASGESITFTTVSTADELNDVRNDLEGNYLVTADIDLLSYSPWTPIGDYSTDGSRFSGIFNGGDHVISNMTISSASGRQGFFGYIVHGNVSGVGLTNVDITTGGGFVGGVVGLIDNGGKVTGCYVTGKLSNSDGYIAGLMGQDSAYNGDPVSECYADVTVTVTSTGYVASVAGVMGSIYAGGMYNCHGSGTVVLSGTPTGFGGNGGLAGWLSGYTVANCYSTTALDTDLTYSSWGALAAAGVSGVSNCFYDSETSGYDAAGGTSSGWTEAGTATSTALMQSESTYTNAGWDFVGESANGTDDIWAIDSSINGGYPYLMRLKDSY